MEEPAEVIEGGRMNYSLSTTYQYSKYCRHLVHVYLNYTYVTSAMETSGHRTIQGTSLLKGISEPLAY